jgi:hypothetical protein
MCFRLGFWIGAEPGAGHFGFHWLTYTQHVWSLVLVMMIERRHVIRYTMLS